MNYMRLLTLAVILAVIRFSCTASEARPKEAAPSAMHWIKDPGNVAPPTADAEYDSYQHPGTSQELAKVVYSESPYHNFFCNTPVLYPQTPYTIWLIEKWAFEADGKELSVAGLRYPGDWGMHITAPNALVGDGHPGAAVIGGKCTTTDDYAQVEFDNVPVGKYILVELIRRPILYYEKETQDVIAYGADGAMPAYSDTYHKRFRPANDGFIVASHWFDVPKAGQSYTLPSDLIEAVASFQNE